MHQCSRHPAGTTSQQRSTLPATGRGAAEAHAIKTGEWIVELITSTVAAALGEERARELRARGVDMDWDQAVAYALTQTTQALSVLQSAPQP
jgi:nitrogen fixation protein FixH